MSARMRRRSRLRLQWVCALALAAFASLAWPQANRTAVIGVLMISAGPEDPIFDAFRAGLRERGYIEGRDYRIEHRSAQGQSGRVPQLARELVDLKVDVLFTGVEPVVRAFRQASSTIPIVMVLYDYDPVASGLVASFGRPGGNITGIATQTPDLVVKRLQILKETLPQLSRVAVFWDRFAGAQLQNLEAAARALGVEVERVDLGDAYDFDGAFALAKARKCTAAVGLFSPQTWVRRAAFGAAARAHRLPTIQYDEYFVRAGALLSYGPSAADSWKRAAYYIDRLLKGAKPQDLPIEQEARVKLAVNQKTAGELGISLPESILLQADEVIR